MGNSTKKVLQKLELQFREIKVLIPDANQIITSTLKADNLARMAFAYYASQWESIDAKGVLLGSIAKNAELTTQEKEFLSTHLFQTMELHVKVRRLCHEAKLSLNQRKSNLQRLLNSLRDQSRKVHPTGDIPTFHSPNSLDIKAIQQELKNLKSTALSKQEEKLYLHIKKRFTTFWAEKEPLKEPLSKILLNIRQLSIYEVAQINLLSTTLRTHYNSGNKAKGKNKPYVLSAFEEIQRMTYIKLKLDKSIRELSISLYSNYLYELNSFLDHIDIEQYEKDDP